MQKDQSGYIPIGKIGATYGVKGWLKINSFAEPKEGILTYDPWYVEHSDKWEPVTVDDSRIQGNSIVAKLAGLDAPEQARHLSGKRIAVKRDQLPALKKQEYYWADLEGLTVINQLGEKMGIVTYLIATGSNDVLIVKGDKEFAIPYLPGTVIINIDLSERIMCVNWDKI